MRSLLVGVSAFSALIGVGLHAQGRGGGDRPPFQGAGPQQPPAQKGSAVVLGQIVDATSGQPIPEATVSVTSRIPIASLQGPTPGSRVQFITGATGQFVLRELPKTNLQITVSAAGYVNGSSGQTRPGGPSRPVEIDEGQRINDLKIRLWKHGVITGTVLDEAGEPAVGVTVRALRRNIVAGRPAFSSSETSTTDDRGVYRLSALTPGEYAIAVPQALMTMPTAVFDALLQSVGNAMPQNTGLSEMAMASAPGGRGGMRIGDVIVTSESGLMPPVRPDGRMFAYQALFYPSATSAAQASVITVRSGEERSGVDLQLKLIPAARISGKVLGPSGPSSMATVQLIPAEVEESGTSAGIETSSANSAPDGTFTFLAVPPGQYVARVAQRPRPPLPPGTPDNPMMALVGRGLGGRGAMLYAQATVNVSSSDMDGLTLTLAEGPKVSGRLQFDGNAAPPTGQQLQAMSVSLTPIGPNRGDFMASPARPGADGQFKTDGHAAGKYTITPTGRGGGAWVLRSVTAGGRNVTDEAIELRDADITDVVITYTDKISQISGTVHASTSTLPAATVVAFPVTMRAAVPSGRNAAMVRTAVVQKSGTFALGNVTPGEYFVAALEDADLPENQDVAFLDAVARVATRVSIAEGDRPSLDLQIVKVRR